MMNLNMSKCFVFNIMVYYLFCFSVTVLKNLENSFLSTSLTKLLNPVQTMFNGENPIPSHDSIDALIRVITRWEI